MQALQHVEYEPEVAYLHLITSGEILTGFFEYKKEEILSAEINDILNLIENGLENGRNISRQISNSLLGIKRSFVKSLLSLVDPVFFESKESNSEFGHFKPDLLEKSIGAAYDLRSKYVHTGVPFGDWIRPRNNLTDLQSGRPIVGNKDFEKILEKAPTFLGLERLIRYCLLKFIASKISPEIIELQQRPL